MAKKVILTIDDEEHILDLLEYNLEKGGYDVLRAETGEKGLAVMKTMQVDLVLLDYMLPGIDGIEVLKTMRADPALVSMPVIMLTAKGEEIDKVLGLDLDKAEAPKEEEQKTEAPQEVIALCEERKAAKAAKDWAKADKLRADIAAMGYTVVDTKEGYKVTKA